MKRKPNKWRGLFLLLISGAAILTLFVRGGQVCGFAWLIIIGIGFLTKQGRQNMGNDLKELFGEDQAAPFGTSSSSLSSSVDPAYSTRFWQVPRVYTIKLPKTTAWNSGQSVTLITKLAHLDRLILRISASRNEMVWELIDVNDQPFSSDEVRRAIGAAYLDADVSEPELLEEIDVNGGHWRRLDFYHQSQEFLRPSLRAAEITKSDPLTAIVNSFVNLQEDEWVSYLLGFGLPQSEAELEGLINLGVEGVTKSKAGAVALGILDAALSQGNWEKAIWAGAGAGFAGTVWGKRQDKYPPEITQACIGKMDDFPLLRCFIAVEANSHLPERLNQFNSYLTFTKLFSSAYQMFTSTSDAALHITSEYDEKRSNSVQLMTDLLKTPLLPLDRRANVFSPSEMAALWHLPHEGMTAREIAWIKGKQIAAPPAFSGKHEGVFLGMNKSGGRSSEIYQPTRERTTHTLVIGKTGVGKTSFMQALVAQDIEADRGVAVIDPLGSFVRRILQHHIPAERESDVVILDIDYQFEEDGGKVRYPPPLNLLARPKDLEDTDASAGSVVSVLAKVFDESEATRFMIILTNAVLLLGAETSPTLLDIEPIILDSEYRNRLLKHVDLRGVQRFWKMFDETYGMQKASVLSALQRLAPFYNNRLLEPITCHPDALDFADLIAKNKIILVSVHADEKRVPELQRNILGATVVSQIQMAALAGAVQDPKNRPFILYVDEVQAFVTSSLDTLARQARQKGLGLVAATQTLKSLSGKTLDAFLGNVGSIVAFESDEPDAKLVLPQMRPFEVPDLMSMGKYRAVVSMRPEGGTSRAAFSLEPVSAPDVSQDETATERELYLRRKSVENYTPKTTAQVKAWLDERYNPQTTPTAAPEKQPPIAPSDDFSDPV